MPYPSKKETESEFIARCMGSKHAVDKYPDQKQRAAVCYSIWRDSNKKKK